MHFIFYPGYEAYQSAFEHIVNNFTTEGTIIGDPNRNTVKAFDVGGVQFNFKSFKIPGLINKIAYRHFRKSKARRSFEYARRLLEKGFGTPQPVAYLQQFDLAGLRSSYYVSKHLQNIFTFRDVISDPLFADRELIIRQYTGFFFRLHEHQVEFKDNSPGNILIEQHADGYELSMVDLNRMAFNQEMSMDRRLGNFCRMTDNKEVLQQISVEYARLAGISPEYAYNKIIETSDEFLKKAAAKRRFKRMVKFYK